MKTIVIYNSQTGFTKQYAQWIAEATGADCLELSKAKRKSINEYEAIVFGSWVCAGGIGKIKWFKKNIDKWANKKLIAFCVGASPIDSPQIEQLIKNNFDDSQMKKVSVFYCQGGLNYDKMHAGSRLMMKMLLKSLNSKKEKTKEDEDMIKMISSSYDISDRKYVEPILECLEK